MSRTGIQWSAVGELGGLLAEHPPLGACTHFHSADADDGSEGVQLERFRSALDALPARPSVVHAENSPAIERLAGPSVWTLVRPGVFLYGVESRDDGARTSVSSDPRQEPARSADGPHGQLRGPPLRSEAVVALRARIVELRWIEAGEGVSYGSTFRATDRRRIATLAVGYADGYRRAFSNVGRALVRGQCTRVVGVVTMDMTMLDVTGIDCAIGDIATLLGVEMAAWTPDGSPFGGRDGRQAIESPLPHARLACACTKCSPDSVCACLACTWTARPDRFSPVYRHRLFSLAVAAAVYAVARPVRKRSPRDAPVLRSAQTRAFLSLTRLSTG